MECDGEGVARGTRIRVVEFGRVTVQADQINLFAAKAPEAWDEPYRVGNRPATSSQLVETG